MKHVLKVLIGMLAILTALAYAYCIGGFIEKTDVVFRMLSGTIVGAALFPISLVLISICYDIGETILKSIRKKKKNENND